MYAIILVIATVSVGIAMESFGVSHPAYFTLQGFFFGSLGTSAMAMRMAMRKEDRPHD